MPILVPGGSEKIVLAAGALQHLLPTPERPPGTFIFHQGDRVLFPGTFGGNKAPDDKNLLTMAMAISPIVYGLVHFLAWSDQFPTPLERLLWRSSSFVVTCSGLAEVSVMMLSLWWEERYQIVSISNALINFICIFIIPLAHILASGFLIVESVRQLLFLDAAAYQLPAWSNFWPHLS